MSTELNRISELAKADRSRDFSRSLTSHSRSADEAPFGSAEGRERGRGWGHVRGSTSRTAGEICNSSTIGWRVSSTGRSRCVGSTSRRRTETEADLDSRSGGQDRAEGRGDGAHADLRAGLPRCSYGFRPGRSPHDALDDIGRVICRRPIAMCWRRTSALLRRDREEQLMEMVERRIGDGSILRLIRKWIHVGVHRRRKAAGHARPGPDKGRSSARCWPIFTCTTCSMNGSSDEVKPRLRGEADEIRYADDFILCFQYREDAERVLEVLAKRFAKYGLTLHPEKTRLMEFGRSALARRNRAGERSRHLRLSRFHARLQRSRRGKFTIHVRTMRNVSAEPEGGGGMVPATSARAGRGAAQPSTRNSGATTSTTDARRTTAVCGSSIGSSGGSGTNGSTGVRAGKPCLGRFAQLLTPPAAAASITHLGQCGESCLRNRVR